MLRHVREEYGMPVSLEVEKPRAGIEQLFEQADLLFFSRDYALAKGFAEAPGLLRSLSPGVSASCTWGADGAWLITRDGHLLHAEAPTLETVVDSVGAGDVFNAVMIHALCSGRSFEGALQTAVALASAQCARPGLRLNGPVD
jgi:ketohexokinase